MVSVCYYRLCSAWHPSLPRAALSWACYSATVGSMREFMSKTCFPALQVNNLSTMMDWCGTVFHDAMVGSSGLDICIVIAMMNYGFLARHI